MLKLLILLIIKETVIIAINAYKIQQKASKKNTLIFFCFFCLIYRKNLILVLIERFSVV